MKFVQKKSRQRSQEKESCVLTSPPSSFSTDFQAYCAYQEQVRGLVSKSLLDEIWATVRDLSVDNPLSPREKFQLACSMTESRVCMGEISAPAPQEAQKKCQEEENTENSGKDLKKKNKKKKNKAKQDSLEDTTRTAWDEFVCTFGELIGQEKLATLWQSAADLVEEEEEDHLEVASVYAMDYLQEHSNQLFGSGQSDRNRKRRMLRKSKRRKGKVNLQDLPHEEAAYYLVAEIFEGDQSLDEIAIKLTLRKHGYEIEAALEDLCHQVLRRGCFVRPGISFAAIVACGSGKETSSKPAGPWRPLIEEQQIPEDILKAVAEAEYDNERRFAEPSPGILASHDYRLNKYFLQLFQQKNPSIKASLSVDGELVYRGTIQSFQRKGEEDFYLLSIVIDLHGLYVIHSLQIVESALEYYQYGIGRSKLGGSGVLRKVLLTFIVGKGLHSVGGRGRIGPAVVNFLRDRGEEDYVVTEGIIVVHVKP